METYCRDLLGRLSDSAQGTAVCFTALCTIYTFNYWTENRSLAFKVLYRHSGVVRSGGIKGRETGGDIAITTSQYCELEMWEHQKPCLRWLLRGSEILAHGCALILCIWFCNGEVKRKKTLTVCVNSEKAKHLHSIFWRLRNDSSLQTGNFYHTFWVCKSNSHWELILKQGLKSQQYYTDKLSKLKTRPAGKLCSI